MHKREMRTSIYKELYWSLGTIALTVIVGLWMFEGRLFGPPTIDIQLHNGYYIFKKYHILVAFLFGVLSSIYMIRGIYYKLNNRIVNGTLTLLLVLFIGGLIFILNMTKELEIRMLDMSFWDYSHRSWAEPFYTDWIQKRKGDVILKFRVVNGFLWTLLALTISILILTGYKTFRKRVV
jgi:hypothetical protein